MPKIASKKIVRIVHNPVVAKLVSDDRDLRKEVADMLSFEVAGSEYMSEASGGFRSSFYKFRTDTFPTGFVRLVRKKLERAGYRVIIQCKPAPDPLGPEIPVVDAFPEEARYSYQRDTAARLISLKGMIAQVATGGGKSRIFKICAERIGRPTLFITTRKSLMYQMAEAYQQDLKKPIGLLGDNHFKPNPTGANFAIVDTLASRLRGGDEKEIYSELVKNFKARREVYIDQILVKRGLPTDTSMMRKVPKVVTDRIRAIRQFVVDNKPIPVQQLKAEAHAKAEKLNDRRKKMLAFLAKMEFVCLEEAHEVSSNSYYQVMNACVNAHYRLALTATPFMKDDEEANMRLMAVTGPIGVIVTEKQLIDAGILATPYFKSVEYPRPKKVYKTTPYARAYKYGIVSSDSRNAEILRECREARERRLPVMILIQRTEHGKLLKNALQSDGIRASFISGSSDQKVRQREMDKLKNGEIDVLIGSTILDVGVDVPAVGMVILAGGGKAEVAFRQRVGRGMRAKKSGPNVVFIVDFLDIYNQHLADHTKHRSSFVASTPGFSERRVAAFDYDGLGIPKAA